MNPALPVFPALHHACFPIAAVVLYRADRNVLLLAYCKYSGATMNILFDHVLKENGSSLTEQVYNAVLAGIRNQEWREGEKLPSYNELVAGSGVSRSVFQSVFRRLEEEGFVVSVRAKGVFVKEGAQSRRPIVGRAAVILGVESTPESLAVGGSTDVFGPLDLYNLQADAGKAGYVISLHHVNREGGISPNLTDGQGEALKGIVSMVPAGCLAKCGALPAPVVYLGVEDDFSHPRVSADICQATRMLTEHLIELGHTKIAFLARPDWHDRLFEKAWRGYAQALSGICQEPDKALLHFLRMGRPLDIKHLKHFLETFSDYTALVCTTFALSQRVVEVCDLLEIGIPEDLSIVSLQHALMRPDCESGAGFTSVTYWWEELFAACFAAFDAGSRYPHIASMDFYPKVLRHESTARLGDLPGA